MLLTTELHGVLHGVTRPVESQISNQESQISNRLSVCDIEDPNALEFIVFPQITQIFEEIVFQN
jgi:hypothetical protein